MYDLAIIGAGWAGFNAALKAKELNLKVCLIDARKIGGTCLHYGCIPTKTLIACAKVFSLSKKSGNFGVHSDNLRLDWPAIQEKKVKIIQQLAQGMQSRLSGIDFINGEAKIIFANQIKVQARIIETKFILVATGSRPLELENLKFDQKKIISSDQILSLTQIPESLLIIGGGVIGCEFASLFSILGTQVTVAEKMPSLLPTEDQEVSRKIEVIFKKKGIKVITNVDLPTLDLENYAKILVSAGRKANTQGLGLEDLGIKLENNKIQVDDYLNTNVKNIYAAGDCTAKIMLAHYAAYQGITAVGNMFSAQKQKADNTVVPACIFTDPQIASVGINQETAQVRGLKISINKFDFRGSAMAQIIEEADGWVKIISEQDTNQIIGAVIIGPLATELIATLTLAISNHLTVDQVRAVIFAHPTFSESLSETLKIKGEDR